MATMLLASCQPKKPVSQPVRETKVEVEKVIPEDFIPRDLTVTAVGDSLTEGIGDSTDSGGYLPYLEAKLEQEKGIENAVVQNYGVKGTRSDQLLKRLRKQEVASAIKDSDMVIITIGGNDIMKVARRNILNMQYDSFAKEKDSYIARLEKIMDLIRKENPGAALVLIGTYNPFLQWFPEVEELDQIVSDWNEAGKNVIASYPNAFFVGIDDIFTDLQVNLLFDDQFHPNDKGYQLIAERVFETLEEEALPAIAGNSGAAGDEESRE
ncbi:GDSL family lipase [Neobacillus notoginsengisoli]|uniref:GDSL family lipase n=2 Tax=Neobacillus notoginsengisoli TaxID=1578198 RepID=A0A417YXP3_9BACI|nr:GDSL family lipase [Neobacillus notoginsengisoli]